MKKKSIVKNNSKKTKKSTISTIPQYKLFPKVTLKLNPFALAYTFSILCPLALLTISLIAKYTGYLLGAINTLQNFYLEYSLSTLGIVTGMIQASVYGIIFGLAFGYLYNKFA